MDGSMLVNAFLWVVITFIALMAAVALARPFGVKVLVGLYTGLVITSAIAATKIITLFTFNVPAGVIVYSASFLITDTISECYGKREAKTAVWVGLMGMILFFLYSYVTVEWESSPFFPNQEAYRTIVGLSARIALAGLIAFIFSQLFDIFIFHLIKSKTKGKWLWLRNITSTVGSQAIDTIVFISIAFYGTYEILPLIIGQYVVKVIIALLDTPFVYAGKWMLKGARGTLGS